MVRSFVLISGIVNGASHKIKKKKKPRNASLSIQSLPNEVLVQVLARVASRSFDDLYSAKLSCKNFNESAQDDHIFEHVDISKFPLVSWRASEKRTRFLKRCRDLGNAEALYRQGMCDLFTSKRIEPAGIESLKRAASKGHVEATYVYGGILVCCGGDSRQKGLELLYSLNCHKSRGLSVTECRERIKELIWNTMWVNREVIGRIVEAHDENAAMKACNDCGDPQGPYTIKQGWDFDDHDKFSSCNSCRWHQELQPDATLEAILWDITTIEQHLCSIEFLYTPRACNEAAHLVASYVMRVGGVHSWDELEPEWLFNTLASDVNISIRI